METKYKLAIVNSHPIQYFAPLHRRLASDPRIDLTVYFCSRQGFDEYLDPGFGVQVKYDVPLVDGFAHKFLPNLRKNDQTNGFISMVNPSIFTEFWRNRYDAVWINGHAQLYSLMSVSAAKIFGMPVITRGETHLGLSQSPLKAALRRPVMGFFYNVLCNACLAIGTRNREFYLEHGIPDEKIFLAPYSVDNAYFRNLASKVDGRIGEFRAQLGLPVDRPLILFASKFERRKRADDLLEAYRMLRERGGEAALVFVGKGEMESELRRGVASKSIPDVYFLGFRNQSELPELYRACDTFVLPSHDEPWGLIVNEVMACGRPVVVSDEVGSVADLVEHGRNGFTFPVGDVEQLSQHLETLMADPGLRERMGEESLRIISSWDIDDAAQGVLRALDWLDRSGRKSRD